MCGRYYISDEATEEIDKLVRQAKEKLHQNPIAVLNRIRSTDIRPSDEAPVLLAADGRIACTWLRWGFPMGPSLVSCIRASICLPAN